MNLGCVVNVWWFTVSVASHDQHPGDGRLPGEKAGRRERALHSAADAGLPGEGGGAHSLATVHNSVQK